jgi:hypothetical protein
VRKKAATDEPRGGRGLQQSTATNASPDTGTRTGPIVSFDWVSRAPSPSLLLLSLSLVPLSPFVLARGPDAASDGSHEGEREGRKEEKRGVSRRRSLFSRCHPKEEKK